ncbi:5-methylcytosine-specific restriction enzyme A [Prauserella flava]|nr:5-methylcytosine-specific restriction enzyme A [Prauserella flava]MCR3735838.1 5-methylcytosine-specific restriction enzyme A [Prauserella salsuginis]
MPRAAKPCSTPGCPELVDTGTGRCADCSTHAERARGTATQRGYDHHHEARFRQAVLAREPICGRCRRASSEHADHWPLSRRQLQQAGHDPNDPANGRGLCASCHSSETARHQPGGWHVHRT